MGSWRRLFDVQLAPKSRIVTWNGCGRSAAECYCFTIQDQHSCRQRAHCLDDLRMASSLRSAPGVDADIRVDLVDLYAGAIHLHSNATSPCKMLSASPTSAAVCASWETREKTARGGIGTELPSLPAFQREPPRPKLFEYMAARRTFSTVNVACRGLRRP